MRGRRALNILTNVREAEFWVRRYSLTENFYAFFRSTEVSRGSEKENMWIRNSMLCFTNTSRFKRKLGLANLLSGRMWMIIGTCGILKLGFWIPGKWNGSPLAKTKERKKSEMNGPPRKRFCQQTSIYHSGEMNNSTKWNGKYWPFQFVTHFFSITLVHFWSLFLRRTCVTW